MVTGASRVRSGFPNPATSTTQIVRCSSYSSLMSPFLRRRVSHEQGLRQAGTLGQRGTQGRAPERDGGNVDSEPDPRTAADIPAFVDRLTELWKWAGSPGYRKKFQEMANQ